MENKTIGDFYWAVLYVIALKQNYTFLTISQGRHELWVKNDKQVIRFRREDINFGVWLRNDLLRLYGQYEYLKGKAFRKQKFLNAYFTEQLPVEDYKEVIEETRTPDVIHLGDIETHLFTPAFFLQSEGEMLQLFGIETEEDIQLFQEAVVRGEKEIIDEIMAHFTEKAERKKQITNFGHPYLTYTFLVIQVFMFLLMEMSGGSTNPEVLVRFGAKFNPLIEAGEWWRFITPLFLHIGLMHLIMNSLGLYYIGSQIERIFGSKKFLIIYLFAGASGVLASFLTNTSISAGASGAIFGCLGALLYVGLKHRDIFSRELVMNVLAVIGLNLAFGIMVPNIDNSGHIGGLIGGFVMAAIIKIPAVAKEK